MTITLRALLGRITDRLSDDLSDGPVADVTADSRRVGPGTVFVAVRGAAADGHRFVEQALSSGASAVVVEDASAVPAGAPVVQVADSRRALAELAAGLTGDPGRSLMLIGVTGTNGKTTTTHLVREMLNRAGIEAGLIGTVQIAYGEVVRPATHTTPDPVELQRTLAEMVAARMKAAVMEVSSHGLEQGRTAGLRFAAAGFTNLTLDHLDYHGTFDAYRDAKKRLFDDLQPEAVAVVNLDDPAGTAMLRDTNARKLTVGFTAEADVRGEIVANRIDGLWLRVRYDGQVYDGLFRLVGRFNGENLLVAFGIGVGLGLAPGDVFRALEQAAPVPGRMELIADPSSGRAGVVDYAHTPDALEKLLDTVHELKTPGGRTLVVFGCGGDRDRSKRPIMGRIAAERADVVVVTSDNPRTEDPDAIIADVMTGIPADTTARVEADADRRVAIRRAVELAGPGDVVVLAGKGHEDYQVIGTTKQHLDDRETLRAAFAHATAQL